jgi:hypothetical protein
MSPHFRFWLPLLAVMLGASPAVAIDFFQTEDEAAFAALYPNRLAPTFVNAGDERLTTIVTPEATVSQIAPATASLLDSDVGFVWSTDAANPILGRLRIEFATPVVAASGRYNWVATGAIEGEMGYLSVTAGDHAGLVGEFSAAGLPFKQGWFGVANMAIPFRSIDLVFNGMSENFALYFFDTQVGGAVEYAPAPALTGDYNGDGSINAADYTLWRSTYGSTVPVAAGADGNADGLVNAADYTVWRDNLSAQPAAIPEPTTLMAAAVIASLFAMRASCRRA